MYYKWYAALALVLALLWVGAELPSPSLEEQIQNIRAECIARSRGGFENLSRDPRFVGLLYAENQLIVTGSPEKVEQVAGVVGLQEVIAGFGLDKHTVSYLYTTSSDLTVQQATCEIDGLEDASGVYADPNYHISPAQWIGGGSSWTQNGGWGEGLDGGGQGNATAEAFWQQWAFGPEGIHLFGSDGTRWGQETGKGTRIAIFDTSPFTGAEWEGNRCDNCSIQELMQGAPEFSDSTMTLTVWHQIELIAAPTCPGYDRNAPEHPSLEDQDISNHGLFVAGLAHAVAPSSEIYLIRVLEDDGCGTLYQIVEEIRAFMDEILAKEQDLRGTVINLSLGVHKAPDELDFGLSNDIGILEAVLREAVDKGAIVVAAAGNDSYEVTSGAPRAMELPAGYPSVVGVAASNERRERGCFSNADMTVGSLHTAAPGGDGVYLNEQEPCTIPDCVEDDTRCLISLVRKPTPGYAYWVGTSFAAPLVSGQAALLLERAADQGPGPLILEYTCPSPDPTLPNGITNWAKVSGSACP